MAMIWNLIIAYTVSIICCFIPLALHMPFAETISYGDNIFVAFNSIALKLTLASCVSLSIPLLLEIARDGALAQSKRIKKNILTNILLVFSLIIPDVIFLSYVLPSHNLRLFMCINQARTVSLISSIYTYFIFFGGEFFQRRVHMCWYILCITATVLFAYGSSSSDPYRIQDWISLLMLLISMGIVIGVSIQWFRKQNLTISTENRHLTTDEYCINIYIISSICCFSGFILAWAAYGFPRFSEMKTDYLIITNVIYALYYVVISVFQGGAVRRDEIIENSMNVKKKFIRYISHEIRTPLNAVSMGLKYLGEELPKYIQDRDILDSVATSQSACSVSVNILTDLLTFDKIEDGALKLDRQEVSIKELVLSATAIFHAQAIEKGVTLTTEIDLTPRFLVDGSRDGGADRGSGTGSGRGTAPAAGGDPDLRALLDRAKMAQVIHNLVSNGLKFTPSGGHVSITVTLEDGQRSPPGQVYAPTMFVKITVADTGVGLSQENIKKLFKEVIQFNPEMLQAGGGSGLGLFISKSILDLHGGSIGVESDGANQGCTFTVLLPVKAPARTTLPPPRESSGGLSVVHPAPQSPTGVSSAAIQFVDLNEGQDNDNDWGEKWDEDAVRIASEMSESESTTQQRDCQSFTSRSTTKAKFFAEKRATSASQIPKADGIPQVLQSSTVRVYQESTTGGPSPVARVGEIDEKCRQGVVSSGARSPHLPRVLVVDDATSNRKMLCRVLRSRCSSVVEADNGQRAVDIVKDTMRACDQQSGNMDGYFDLILMDFVMPVMDGPTAIKEIRDLGYKGVIFGLTGNVLDGDKDLMLARGANFVLTKPCFNVDIYDRVSAEFKVGIRCV